MKGLFDDLDLAEVPAAAAADPETSHEAAGRHTASGARRCNAARVLELVRLAPGSTAVELWHQQLSQGRLDRHEVSRRLSDLLRKGLVTQGPERYCRVRARLMVTWWPVGQVGAADEAGALAAVGGPG